jgi:hypothetical protein
MKRMSICRLPDFLFVGSDKSGSTWLYELLRSHPKAYVPTCKDIYFFDRYFHRGLSWYAKFFRNALVAAVRIRTCLPEIQLVTCLRDPVERAFSQFLYLQRNGLTKSSFGAALDEFPDLIERSLYYEPLRRYFELFPRAQIKVLLFEKLQANPAQFAQGVFEFLHLPFDPGLEYDRRVLPASRPRSAALARAFRWGANLARDVKLVTLVGRVKRSRMAAVLYQPYADGERPRMPDELEEVLRRTFAPDVERLEDLLEMDLRHWRIAGRGKG